MRLDHLLSRETAKKKDFLVAPLFFMFAGERTLSSQLDFGLEWAYSSVG